MFLEYYFKVSKWNRSNSSRYRIILVSGGRDSFTRGWIDSDTNLASKKLKDRGHSTGSFIIEAFYLGFDGNRFGPVNETFQIRKYVGEKDITTLPVYPLACDPDHGNTKKVLIERGQEFAQLSSPKTIAHRKYKGLTLDPKHQEHVCLLIISAHKANLTHRSSPKWSSTSS